MKPLQVSEPASQELAEAVRWYEERRPGWPSRLIELIEIARSLRAPCQLSTFSIVFRLVRIDILGFGPEHDGGISKFDNLLGQLHQHLELALIAELVNAES